MWNKGNLYGSSCTCMYSREFTLLGTCGTSKTARHTVVAVLGKLRETGTVLAIRVFT